MGKNNLSLDETIIGISQRVRLHNADVTLFDSPSIGSKGIKLKEDERYIREYLDEKDSRKYFLFGLPSHDGWKILQNPYKSIAKGMIMTMIAYANPSHRIQEYFLKKIGVNFISTDEYGKNMDKVMIARHCMLDFFFPHLITLGYNTTLGFKSVIETHTNLGEFFVIGKVDIGNNVVIGADSIIGPGVKIGDYSKINVRSVVIKDVPEGSVCMGNPAQVISKRKYRISSIEGGVPIIRKKDI